MDIAVEEDVRIPMADGVTLSARIWRPTQAEHHPVPAVLEYIPYRKRDHTRARDETLHGEMARRGYAGVRVDLRGSGESTGVLDDEYCQRELDDGYAVIEWLARQPWCNGAVGMLGISWGGFNGLQIAAMQPPALKAVISVCSSDDRYADDVHYMGGCLLGDNLSWASVMFAYNSLPPDPALRPNDWRALWHQRLEANEPWLIRWLAHQQRDAYWQHASVCENYQAIRCPVMAISGWADGYTDAVFRLLENLDVPTKGLVGPWSHKYPHQGVPGPAIDFHHEMQQWWDTWLKGKPAPSQPSPKLSAWMQEAAEPATRYHQRPGYWVGEAQWPSGNIHHKWLYPHRGGHLHATPASASEPILHIQSPLSLGLFAGKWCSYSAGPDLPYDQREEDGGALFFESDPFEQPMELLGEPEFALRFRVDQPVAQVAARLSDVAPDGKATRITYGVYNLNHYRGHNQPEALEPGQDYSLRFGLNHLGHRLTPGHRLRLSLSTSYWPLAWPAPQPVALSVITADTALGLPVRQAEDHSAAVAFDPPAYEKPLIVRDIEPGEQRWRVLRDLETSASTLEVIKNDGRYQLSDIDLEVADDTREYYRSIGDDFASIEGEVVADRRLRREGWDIATRTRTVLQADAHAFYVYAELDAWENGQRVFSRNWHERIARRYV